MSRTSAPTCPAPDTAALIACSWPACATAFPTSGAARRNASIVQGAREAPAVARKKTQVIFADVARDLGAVDGFLGVGRGAVAPPALARPRPREGTLCAVGEGGCVELV